VRVSESERVRVSESERVRVSKSERVRQICRKISWVYECDVRVEQSHF
jgi:hypothetical protein